MRQMMVRYRVKPESADENVDLVKAGIRERCDEAPVVSALDRVGAYES